jgi:hypothetical protein
VIVVGLDVDDVRSHVVFDRGRGAAWAPGDSARAEMRLCWTARDASRLATGALTGTEAMAATRIVDASTPELDGAMPPSGFVRGAPAAHVPAMLGASLVVQFATGDGPFGPFAFVLELIDGIPRRERFGTVASADVVVTLSFRAIASVFADRISVLEAVAGGQVAGELAALAALAGVFEGDELRALMARSAGRAQLLASLGNLPTTPAFRAALTHVSSAASRA